jgi:hypothetical protein
MAFYTADLFPAWKGGAFIGPLRGVMLDRLTLSGVDVVDEEPLRVDCMRASAMSASNLRERSMVSPTIRGS